MWAHRMMLEGYKHGDSCFVTLTYDDKHVPRYLDKSHYQGFLKRLRKVAFPRKIRYFLAGEYGELSARPHFHAILFGIDPISAGGSDGRSGLVQKCWNSGKAGGFESLGYTFVGELTHASASYVAGYLTKKLGGSIDDEHREFARMSLRPGIGAWAMDDVARALQSDHGMDSVVANGDVPSVLRSGKRMLPLGRYLRRELRGKLGFASKDTPPGASRMYAMQKAIEKIEERSALREAGLKTWEAEKIMLDRYLQKINNMESRFRVRDSKGRL